MPATTYKAFPSAAQVKSRRSFQPLTTIFCMSEKERLRISADYYALVTGELEKEAQTYQLWIQSYPHDPIPHGNLGVNFISLGQYDKSLAESEESQRLGPNNFISYLNLGLAYLALNRPDHAKATFEQALARKLDGGGLRLVMY